jgi:large subunit ribosomal protein L4
MELNVINIMKKNDIVKKIDFASSIFNSKFNESLVHQIVTSYLSNGRTAIKAEKSRSQVSGGGIKPFRQKGTGKARAGSIRSPIWRGGGKTFTATQLRNYKKKINKKMYKVAIRCIFF